MKALLKAEFIQLTTTRTALWWTIIVFALTLIPTLIFMTVLEEAHFSLKDFLLMQGNISFLILLFSIVAVTGGYRHRVAVTEYLISPTIWQTTVSKLIVFGACGALAVLLQSVLITGVAAIWPQVGFSLKQEDFETLGLALMRAALAGMLGVAIARLLRVQVGSVLGTIAYFIILEPTFQSNSFGMSDTLHDKIGAFLPGMSLQTLMDTTDHPMAGPTLAAWILLIAGAAYLLDRKRDWR